MCALCVENSLPQIDPQMSGAMSALAGADKTPSNRSTQQAERTNAFVVNSIQYGTSVCGNNRCLATASNSTYEYSTARGAVICKLLFAGRSGNYAEKKTLESQKMCSENDTYF